MNGHTNYQDNQQIRFGASQDLVIQHDGSNSKIHHGGSGGLKVTCDDFQVQKNDGSEWIMRGMADGAVSLYYDNSKKFETTSGGATVTGTMATAGASLNDAGAGAVSVNAGGDIRLPVGTWTGNSGSTPKIQGHDNRLYMKQCCGVEMRRLSHLPRLRDQ